MVSFQWITLSFLLVSGALFAYLIPCSTSYVRHDTLPFTGYSFVNSFQDTGT